MTDTMRDRFEKWVVSTDNHQFFMVGRPRFERHEYGSYVSATCQHAWEAWQASQADARALVGELVAVLKFADENLYEINVNNYDHDEVCHLNSMSVEVAVSVQEALTKAQAFMEGKV